MEKVVLDRVRLDARTRVSPYLLHNMEVSQWADHLTGSIVLAFRTEVLAKTLATETTSVQVDFESPASTWQMFKHSHREGRWLGWMARRWGVRMATQTKSKAVEVKTRAAFPDCDMVFPKSLGNPVLYRTLEA